MHEAMWELYDGLCKALLEQGRRIEQLEGRVESLLREQSARTREADTFGERPTLNLVEPDQSHLCGDCNVYHSAELPCPTPVEEAWKQFGDKVQI